MSTYKITEEDLKEMEKFTSRPHTEWDLNQLYGADEMEDYKLQNPEKAIKNDREPEWEPMSWEDDVDTLDMPPEVIKEIYEGLEDEFDDEFDEFDELQEYYDEQDLQRKYAKRGQTRFNTRNPNTKLIDWFGDDNWE